MARKTRRHGQELIGGAKLGEGHKGVVYDLQCMTGEESFCKILDTRKKDISGIILHGPSGRSTIGTTLVADFIKYIDRPGLIAKILKNKKTSTRKSMGRLVKRRIDDEVRTNIKIIKLFGLHGDKFLSIDPHLSFHGQAFVACTILYAGGNKTHVLFGQKCSELGSHGGVIVDKLLVDILKCIEYMGTIKIRHNDIKADNIMICDGAYKLIDWGNATFNNDLLPGLFCGPLAKYLMGSPVSRITGLIPKKLASKDPEMLKSELFTRHYIRSVLEFKALVKSGGAATYKGSHDLYGLGLTLIQLCVRYKLDCAKYDTLIGLLMGYSGFTASDALKLLLKN